MARLTLLAALVLLAGCKACEGAQPGPEPPAAAPQAQPEPVEYTDPQGNRVRFALGQSAFASAVASFTPGDPPCGRPEWAEGRAGLGPPDYHSDSDDPPTSVTLGCGGALVLDFGAVVLVDGEGPDLHVFECGPQVEAFNVAISPDGSSFVDVGDVRGQPAAVDIADAAEPGASYRFVRLTDLRASCGGQYPGADIDAVGLINARLAR